jgi:MFS family permease
MHDAHPRPALPAGVWVLGFVSLLMDVSSEMIHSLLPLFLVGTLGLSVLAVGVIEGIAEATALIVKVFSGALSDGLGRRKGLAVLGYAMGALSKPVFALATGAGLVVAARFVDRVGKGIRGAPRDALLADITPPAIRGAAFGLRQSLDTVGAFTRPAAGHRADAAVGERLARRLLGGGDPRRAGGAAAGRGRARTAAATRREARQPDPPRGAAAPGPGLLAGGGDRRGVHAGALFSEAFLVLRAPQVGIAAAWVPLVMVAMNLVYAATAYPFGTLSDRMDHRRLLAAGLVVLIAADLLLASAEGWPLLLAGVALWGVHMGMTQGLLAAMVADTAPADLRGTAYGFFNLLSGIAMLAASVIAGLLWDRLGSAVTFYAGAGFAAVTLLGLRLLPRRR